MRRSDDRETKRETEIIGFMTLLCYAMVLAAIVLSAYSLATLSLSAVEQQIRIVSIER